MKLLTTINNILFKRPKMRKSRNVFLNNILSKDISDFKEIAMEMSEDLELHNLLKSNFESENIDYSPQMDYSWPVVLYYIIRKLKPKIFVETGVWHGLSSVYILSAIKKNGKGKLISVDLPALASSGGFDEINPFDSGDHIQLPEGKDPGWIVPNYLKENWTLRLGESKKLLPEIFSSNQVDIFLHDSDHSVSNMDFEFNLAYESLDKGYIFADNIHWNSSFNNFCKAHNLPPYSYYAYQEGPNLVGTFGGTKIDTKS